MKRLVRWTIRILAVLSLAVAVLVAYVYAASSRALMRNYAVTPAPISVPSDAASIARGKYLTEAVATCTECHGKDLGGRVFLDNAAMGRFVAPNLTRGRGGLGASYADQDFVRVILHGVRRDGRSVTLMPSDTYRFTEADLAAIIAYVRSVPPVDREVPAGSVGPVARALSVFANFPLAPASTIDHERAAFAQPTQPGDPVSAGAHLVEAAGCRGCHGPELAGGGGPPPGAANITPVGIGRWTERDFITAIREHKRPNGTAISNVMPLGYGQMSDEDLRAILTYLKTVPAKGTKAPNQ
jgi:mono/diheme cytochrome c family protein